ncbi:transmembrane protein [Mucor ambiguus]|uniref:Transmembrane protein n=1 Tax=Mucor ambiguus TaxID=91626 RepID=A0A0C9LVC7_9FUNG|nr:transmembrane protein [Mucor ambiguus]
MSVFTLSKTWQVLGPFPIGTREQDFGADPLENYGKCLLFCRVYRAPSLCVVSNGLMMTFVSVDLHRIRRGFQKLRYSTGATYPSELVEGGFVGWTMISSNNHTLGPIDFNVRWSENRVPFGWSIEQYQAWARGILITHEPMQLFVQVSGVSEFYIHGTRYHGDSYGYNTTTHLIQFDKGTHAIDVRMVHDVRIFGGGTSTPQCQFHVKLEPKDEALLYPEDCAVITPSAPSNSGQQTTPCELLMPDYLSDIGFASSYGSVSIQNAGDDPMKVQSVTLCIVDDHSMESRNKNGLFMEYKTELIMDHGPLYISPGQTRPVGFSFQKEWGSLPATTKILRFWVRIGLAIKDSNSVIVATSAVVEGDASNEGAGGDEFAIRATGSVRCIDWLTSAFKYTFLDYDSTVQYAMAKRPHVLNSNTSKPILVALHGAGVEADSSFWINSIPAQKHCWIVFPTGRTPWGYDWHGPSTRNVFKSLEGLAEIQELLPPHFECMDFATGGDWVTVSAPHETTRTLKAQDDRDWNIGSLDKLIVMGHSNGGQGVWHLAVHFPDKIIAVVPAAGYIKIQDYVSFANWVGNSYCDPWLRGILESSIAEYNNDLHLSNMVNIAVLPRVGTRDDNVPPLHTRKYVRILNGHLQQPAAIKTSEVMGQGHWWDTVFHDKTVQQFLDQHSSPRQEKKELNEFCITLMNPAGNGSGYGIHVEQMMIPYRLGKIKGVFTTIDNNSSSSSRSNSKTILTLKTTNIASFRFTKHFKGCNKLIVDGDKFSHLEKYHTEQGGVTLSFDGKKSKRWKLESIKSNERNAANYGPIHRMYESTKPLVVIIPSCSSYYKHVALQITHDWYLYGRGDSMILYDTQAISSNMILDYPYHIYLGLVCENRRIESILADKPNTHIGFEKAAASTITGIKVGDKVYRGPGTGILFMHPVNKTTTAIVVSGVDHGGFESAWHLLPRRTGMMVPEWIVTSSADMKSNGLGGVLGAGYFDNEWKPFGYIPSNQPKSEPISILKHTNSTTHYSSILSSSNTKSARIVLSEDEDDHRLSDGDNDDDEQNMEPMSAEALELLETEKVLKAGYLLKKGEKRRTWKKRWFVLRTTKLAMYKDKKEYKLLRIIDLHEIHKVVQVTSKHKYKFVFAFVTAKRMYYVQANDQQDMDDWFRLVNQAKEDLRLYDADDDTSSIDRDQEFAKDVITSYKSNHVANVMQNQRRQSSGTYDNSARSLVASSSAAAAGVPTTTAAAGGGGGATLAASPPSLSNNEIISKIKPMDIPKHKKQTTSPNNSLSTPLGEYALGHTYPLSPSSDRTNQMSVIEGIASSEDDEEYSVDRANIQSEESRNRVLIEGYLLKLGRNKGWRKRWFVLRTDTLAYYEDDKEYSPHRIIPLHHIIDSLEIDPVSKSKRYCFKIIIPKRSYVLCASTEDDMDAWLNALVVAIRRAKKEAANESTKSLSSTTPSTPQPQQHQQFQPRHLSQIPENKAYDIQKVHSTTSSADSFENVSHISGVSGAGGVGGAGGALGGAPTSATLVQLHSRASERLGRAK